MLTQDQIQEMLEAAKPSIIESLKKELSQSIGYEVKEELRRQVQKCAQEWITSNVVPEVTRQLIEEKEGLISAALQLAPAMNALLVEAMTKEISERLSQSWNRKKIFEAMFG